MSWGWDGKLLTFALTGLLMQGAANALDRDGGRVPPTDPLEVDVTVTIPQMGKAVDIQSHGPEGATGTQLQAGGATGSLLVSTEGSQKLHDVNGILVTITGPGVEALRACRNVAFSALKKTSLQLQMSAVKVPFGSVYRDPASIVEVKRLEASIRIWEQRTAEVTAAREAYNGKMNDLINQALAQAASAPNEKVRQVHLNRAETHRKNRALNDAAYAGTLDRLSKLIENADTEIAKLREQHAKDYVAAERAFMRAQVEVSRSSQRIAQLEAAGNSPELVKARSDHALLVHQMNGALQKLNAQKTVARANLSVHLEKHAVVCSTVPKTP